MRMHLPWSFASVLLVVGAGGCPGTVEPEADVLRVEGTLERKTGVDGGTVPLDYRSQNARAEWWPCDLRLTAGACVDGKHVNVYMSLANIDGFEKLGRADCADDDGNAFGVYELLRARIADGERPTIPNDVQVMVLLASDTNGNGVADVNDDGETSAATVLSDGEVLINSIAGFDDELALTIDGKTKSGDDVHIEVSGPSTPVTQIPGADVERTCVANDDLNTK